MLNINENTGLSGNITVTDTDSKVVTALLVNCNLNSDATNLNFSINVVNKDALTVNLDAVQAQLNDFKAKVLTKMQSLGYQITI